MTQIHRQHHIFYDLTRNNEIPTRRNSQNLMVLPQSLSVSTLKTLSKLVSHNFLSYSSHKQKHSNENTIFSVVECKQFYKGD